MSEPQPINLDIPIACHLPEPALVQRQQELKATLFQRVTAVQELADGYALRFPGDETTAETLLTFIQFERRCCPFFHFELSFEPAQGPIWLRLRGGEGVKEFIHEELQPSATT